MTEAPKVDTMSEAELLGLGRRHLAVRDYDSAAECLAKACEQLAKKHGDTADQCAEAYLWYGKSLLGLSREENGVLGDGVPGGNENEDNNEDQDENGDGNDENGEDNDENGQSIEVNAQEADQDEDEKTEGEPEKAVPQSTAKDAEPGSSKGAMETDEAGTSNGEANEEEANLDNEDEVENIQLAWEMLDLSRSILLKRVEDGGGEAAKALLADVHLALGEVALESETYDKAVSDMQKCLELQKELYSSHDRRIAETHYQIGLANSLASNFEDAITHFKNAANILETRIKTLENPTAATEDATVKKFASSDPGYSVESEIKELKELLPEIQEKIQDMMDYKAETIKRVKETLFPSNGEGSSQTNGASSSSKEAKPAASDISHLIKRKRKSSETDSGASAPKRANT